MSGPSNVFVATNDSNDVQKKLICAFLISTKQGFSKLNCLVDTGSQLSIIQESIIKLLFTPSFIKNNKSAYSGTINSYTNNSIEILYKIKFKVKLSLTSDRIELCFHVIPDLSFCVPKVLLGADQIRLYRAEIRYDLPLVSFRTPALTNLQTFFVSDEESHSGRAIAGLVPKELRSVKVNLPSFTSALNKMNVFVEGFVMNKVEIFPTLTAVILDEISQELFFMLPVENLSNKNIHMDMTIPFQIDSRESIPITNNNIDYLTQTYPKLISPAYLYPVHQSNHKILNISSLPDLNKDINFLDNSVYNTSITDDCNNTQGWISEEGDIGRNDPSPEDSLKDPDFSTPKGYQIEKSLSPEEIVNLDNFDPAKRKFIADIFINKFPGTLSQHSLDRGHLSETLGFYHIALKAGMKIPSQKRVYTLDPSNARHLKDILDFMLKNNIISKVPISKKETCNFFGAPAFLVPRQNPDSSARLVIDYSKTNTVIEREQSIIPHMAQTIHSLRNFTMFSVVDISNAYNSFDISEESQDFTRFSTHAGQFNFKTLPTGLSISSAVWSRIIMKILHEKIIYDEKGQVVKLTDNTAKMEPSFLEGVFHFFDDILICSKLDTSYSKTLTKHFDQVSTVMK